jgi:uncharacterized protein YacL (UPF0231 family)
MEQSFPVKVTGGGLLYLKMPEELTILEDFMIIDLNLSNIQKYLQKIEDALNNQSSQEMTGNSTSLTITYDTSVIYSTHLNKECTLATEKLRDILTIYLKESLLLTIKKDIMKKQRIYEKARTVSSTADILKIIEALEQDKII